MQIVGFLKTTLLDYPEHLAATIFLGGCNLNCPFCHNSDILRPPFLGESYTPDEILSYLQKRSSILEGVCITGGEPTLQVDLTDFIRQIKDLGLRVKLDTNGTNPDLVKSLYQEQLIDYVAMDIKSGLNNYPFVCGLTKEPVSGFDEMTTLFLSRIQETIHFLIHETDPERFSYEFRTTVVKPLHSVNDFVQIASLIQGATAYYLQSFQTCNNELAKDFDAYDASTMKEFASLVSPYVASVSIRNTDF